MSKSALTLVAVMGSAAFGGCFGTGFLEVALREARGAPRGGANLEATGAGFLEARGATLILRVYLVSSGWALARACRWMLASY